MKALLRYRDNPDISVHGRYIYLPDRQSELCFSVRCHGRLSSVLPPGHRWRATGRLMSAPQPTEITLHQASRVLEIAFSDGETFRLPCEFLRVYSPSAEVRGHGPTAMPVWGATFQERGKDTPQEREVREKILDGIGTTVAAIVPLRKRFSLPEWVPWALAACVTVLCIALVGFSFSPRPQYSEFNQNLETVRLAVLCIVVIALSSASRRQSDELNRKLDEAREAQVHLQRELLRARLHMS